MPGTLFRLVLVPALALIALLSFLASLSLAAQLLVNPGLNSAATYLDTGRDWRTFDEKVAAGWWYYYVGDGTYEAASGAPKLHWMSSQQFKQAFGGLDYYREGDAAQVIWSSYDFDAGIYQQVGGLEIGRDYAFEIAVASYWRGSGYPITHGKIKKCVGTDPYGGTDPTASSVIWDWDNCDATDKTWPYLDMAATAQATTMTLFVRVQSPENDSTNHTDLNYVFLDDGRLTLAPTVTLTALVASDAQVHLEWSATSDPDWTLQGVEVQYQDHIDGIWHSIQGKTGTSTSYTFQGQPGHTYTVRARAWQGRGGFDLHGLWMEKQVQVKGAFVGYVRNNFDLGVAGALISTTGRTAESGVGGFYGLRPTSYAQLYTLTVSADGYQPPPPIKGAVANDTSITPITFTLKPANDAIINGDFEINSAGWSKVGAGSLALLSGDHRSGIASLKLTGPISLTQVVSLTSTFNPALSFWHKPDLLGAGSFQVSLSQGNTVLASKTFTHTLAPEWQHAWLSIRQPSQYNGALTVSFSLTGGQVVLDEVSLGNGPHSIFLPIVLK